MRNQYHIPMTQRPHQIALIALLLISLIYNNTRAQSLKIIATGTGQTTGHIATLGINNTTGSPVTINAQSCYIPSEGKYQPYVAKIPATVVPAGTSQIIVEGYCADVFALPVPMDYQMPLISTWIPVTTSGTTAPQGGTNILAKPPLPAFSSENIPGLIQAKGYTPLATSATTPSKMTWPNTMIAFEGTINPSSNTTGFAPVLVEAVHSLTQTFDGLKSAGSLHTPYSGDPIKERDAVIQQAFWIYTAAITGRPYEKELFNTKVVKQYEANHQIKFENLSKEEQDKLTSGIDVFWNTFINVGIGAKVINGTSIAVEPESTANTIVSPWDKIELTDVRMKPGNDNAAAAAFPWIPVIAGTVAAGTVAYFVLDKKEETDTIDCTFTASAIPTNSTCGLSNGGIALNVTPPGSYTYQWSNGSVTPSISNIPAGSYAVTITRSGTSCSQVVQSTVNNQQLSFNATISAQNTDCNQPNGTLTVTTTPPGSYTYQWSNGATTQNQSQLPAGNYTVTISAGGTCEKVLSAQISTAPFNPTVTFTTTPSTCGGSDGAATILVNPPDQYTYTWSNGQTGSSVSGLAAGSYDVTVSKPGTSCMYSTSVVVTDISGSFSVSVTSTMSGCGLSNGTATAMPDPPGSYMFLWSNGQTGPQATGLSAGTYTVTVSITGTSCTQQASVTVTETPASFVVSLTSTPASCGISDGTASAAVTPPGEYTYQWSNGQSGPQITGLAAGTYSVTVSLSGENCTKQASITVTADPFPYSISFTTTPASCGGSDGTSTVAISPQGEANYQWSNGQTGTQLSGVQAGTYSVTVTVPGTNCSKVATTTIDQLPAAFTVTATTTPAGCGMNNGTAAAAVDPPGNYTYTWSNGQTGSQLSGIPAGSYTVTVSITGTSCSKTGSATVQELPPSFTLSFTTTPAGCGMQNGSASVQVTPPGSYTYLWSNGGTGMQINNVGSGNYTVTVTMTGTSCSATGTVHVDQTGGSPITATFATVNADCGLNNGTATITVSPPGAYTYLWSNDQTGITLTQVGPGTYTVTVTDSGSCTEDFSVTIGEDVAEYINILNTTPGTCAGGGDIRFTLTTPGNGPLNVQVTGPGGVNMFTSGPGVFNLSAFMMVLPGFYSITVTDQNIGPTCSETVTATVADISPPIDLEDDFYTAQGSTPLSENALENDEGLNLQMTQVDNEVGGTVTYFPNGNFTFIADIGFSGEASFLYTVTDACGHTATAEVTIIVEAVPCDIDVIFDVTPASCGLEDGSITAIVNGPGEYEFEWSNGDSGPTITNLAPGGYAVTITDLDSGCTYEDSYLLEGLPGNYIEDIVVINPTCESDGDIQFMAISPGGNTLNMLVQHPFGGADFDIEEGLITLSDYVTTVPGEYFVEVSDPLAGPGCSESFTVTINPPPTPVIQVTEVFPASGSGAMDGSAFVEVTAPGQLPYAVYKDGLFAFTINQNNFFLINLSPGVHTVHIVDIQGCQSNTVQFVVPVSAQGLSIGVGITDAGSTASNEQPTLYQPGKIWRSVFSGSYYYDIGRVQQMVRVLYAPGVNMHLGESVSDFMAMEYLSGPRDLVWKGLGLRAQAGIGTYLELTETSTAPSSSPFYWLIRASIEHRLTNRIILSGSVSARGLDYIAPIRWEFGVRVPYLNWKKSGGG